MDCRADMNNMEESEDMRKKDSGRKTSEGYSGTSSDARSMRSIADARARALCADPSVREEMRLMVRRRINARARDIRAGRIVVTEDDVRRIRSEAARMPRTGGCCSPSVAPQVTEVAIPRTKAAMARLVGEIESDREMFAAVAREMARIAREENRGLTRRQKEEKARSRTSRKRNAYTVTDLVRARIKRQAPKMIDATRKYFEFGGERHCIREWAEIRGISYTGMRNRLRLYSPEVALSPNFSELFRMPGAAVPKSTGKSRSGVAHNKATCYTTRRGTAKVAVVGIKSGKSKTGKGRSNQC